MDTNAIKQFACDFVDKNRLNLKNLSSFIWNNPETAFKEFKSHNIITTFLEDQGFDVSRETPLTTSFIACSSGNNIDVVVGVCCEYDALPVIGHACGHNLIAESSIGAALGNSSDLSILFYEIFKMKV